MDKEVSAARIQSLKDRGIPSYPDDNSLKAQHSASVVYCFGRQIRACLVEEHPGNIVLSVKNERAPNSDEGYLALMMPLEQAEALARSILGIDPPIEQQILEELRELRRR